jgi:hypothetical protein
MTWRDTKEGNNKGRGEHMEPHDEAGSRRRPAPSDDLGTIAGGEKKELMLAISKTYLPHHTTTWVWGGGHARQELSMIDVGPRGLD